MVLIVLPDLKYRAHFFAGLVLILFQENVQFGNVRENLVGLSAAFACYLVYAAGFFHCEIRRPQIKHRNFK
ncbi:MAG: hypothetical protein K2N58_10815 [Treponemataceae bacterium]|nr:hypothetical protein [Treponemataceae bacterium]